MSPREEILDERVVRVWRIARYWWIVFLFPFLFLFPYADEFILIPIILTISLLWLSTYLIRQRWRLTLTNNQIVARQLFPRPFTFLSNTHHFPLHTVEGLSIGPRAFRTILLIGVFITTNLGVTLLKSGLSQGYYDPPDSIDAILLIMYGITFIPFIPRLARNIDESLAGWAETVGDLQIVLGIIFLLSGLFIVIATIPRRYHLQIRVRHGQDFKLNAGIPKEFWRNCYRQMYGNEVVDPPKEYRKWRYPWLEGEKLETNADLEQTIYANRLIGILAIYAGSLRITSRLATGDPFLQNDFVFWVIVAITDVFIAVLGVVFSKKKNEMVVTNKRIIFAQEIQDISGAFGRRLYLMSDIRRDDVAGFNIFKIRGMSYRYLIFFILSVGFTIFFFDQMSLLIKVVFIVATLAIGSFVLQTYLEFNLKTKGGEVWHMRHQLSNPLTMMRQIVGDENIVLTTILSNRLEEKEVVDTMQIIRKDDTQLIPKIFEDSKYFAVTSAVKPNEKKDKRREIELEDLLMENEKVQYQTNVSRKVPRRVLNLSIGSLLMLSFTPLILFPSIYSVSMGYQMNLEFFFLTGSIIAIILIIALWIRYYSLFKASIVITDKRIFFMDIKNPPTILFLLGILSERRIDETLRDQIHSTYTSRALSQQQYWRDLVYYGTRFFLYISVIGIFIAIFVGIIDPSTGFLDQYSYLSPLIIVFAILIQVLGAYVVWMVGNSYVTFIRSLPKRVIHTRGIGSHFIIPFASKEKADNINQTVWKGVIQEN